MYLYINILHGADGRAHMEVDMGFELSHQINVVWDHPAIVQDNTIFLHTAPIVAPTIDRISILWERGLFCEVAGKSLGADTVLVHTRLLRVKCSTGPM